MNSIGKLWSASLFAVFLVAAASTTAAMAEPGKRHFVTPADMPEPYATQSVANSAHTQSRSGRAPTAPVGYTVTLFAEALAHPRNIIAAGDGSVYVAESHAGKITLLKDTDGDGRAELRRTVASGLSRPHGLALRDGYLWVADLARVWRFLRTEGTDGLGPAEAMSAEGSLGPGTGHWTRNIEFSADGRHLYAAIGSRSNIAEEDIPRATIQRFDVAEDGRLSNRTTFATGLRNPVGIALQPESGQLYTVVNERDGMGDGLVPDYLTAVKEGGFYGWPYAYIGANPMPGYADRAPDKVAATIVPDVLFQSHSAPLGLAFLADANVPDDWKDDALVTLHGSWNANIPTGYKVVRIPFENGRPTGAYIDFLTGFRIDEENIGKAGNATVWGRPMGITVLPSGAILVGDDAGRTIWHIARTK